MRLFKVIKRLIEEHERRMYYKSRITPDEFLFNCTMFMIALYLLVYHEALIEIFFR